MSSTTLPTGRRYAFDVELEIENTLSLQGGELGTLLIDRLFELDVTGKLFPGVSGPGKAGMLLTASVRVTGIGRSADAAGTTTPNARRRGQLPSPRASGGLALRGELEDMSLAIDDIIMEQRMLQAKLRALVELIDGPGAVGDQERASAGQLLAACAAMVDSHNKSVKPAL